MARRTAIGLTPHTGWAACVVVGGTLAKPEVIANAIIEMLGDDERFCFHMAETMGTAAARAWIAGARKKATAAAKRALAPLVTAEVAHCAIVAKPGDPKPLDEVLASHPRIHTAEGQFYRDVLVEACPVPAQIVPPALIDISGVAKLAPPPWGKDQKLAAAAAWSLLEQHMPRARTTPPR